MKKTYFVGNDNENNEIKLIKEKVFLIGNCKNVLLIIRRHFNNFFWIISKNREEDFIL